MPSLSTQAIVLATFRYAETSKIVRLATEGFGVQSAIAKGALRPKSRFGAALQVLSEGHAHLIIHSNRDLQLLTAFDLQRVPLRLAESMERYAGAAALAELMLRFAPADAHPESFHLLREGLGWLETAADPDIEATGLKVMWALVAGLGFAPEVESCVRDGTSIGDGKLTFSYQQGGALCPTCARSEATATLSQGDRVDLMLLLDPSAPLPELAPKQAAAHRRLLGRYITHHLSEGSPLPALEFWLRRPWIAA
ncbi:MAG: DNA repair protein RecO [Gemmatimonadota bacterium]